MDRKRSTVADDELAGAWHTLMGQFHRISCTLDRELTAKHALTSSEFEVLQQLQAAGDDVVLLRRLGDQVHLTQSALSRLISRLNADGLIERGMCDEDRRSVWARLTPAGAQRFKEARTTQRAILRAEAVGCLPESVLNCGPAAAVTPATTNNTKMTKSTEITKTAKSTTAKSATSRKKLDVLPAG